MILIHNKVKIRIKDNNIFNMHDIKKLFEKIKKIENISSGLCMINIFFEFMDDIILLYNRKNLKKINNDKILDLFFSNLEFLE